MKKKRSGCALLAGLLLLLIIISGAILYPHVKNIKDSADRLIIVMNELNTMVDKKDLDLNKYQEKVTSAHKEIGAIQTEVSPYYELLKQAAGLPRVGVFASQVEPMIEAADQSLTAVEEILSVIILPAQSQLINGKSSILVQQINEGQSKISSAAKHIQKANNYVSLIDSQLYPDTYQKKLQTMKDLLSGLNEATSLLSLLPRITGADKPVTYLIMVQNSDELRATGGFVTAFGLLRLEKGQITLLEFQDSSSNYISERIDAPLPLKNILFAHYWLPRDANWDPSFPEAASKVQQLYFLSTGIKTDGVIAVHQSTLKKVLEFTGPISVSGESVDKDNVEDYMISEKMEALFAKRPKERKNFIKPLFAAILSKLPAMSGSEHILEGIQLLKTLADDGDILLMSNDAEIQATVRKFHLDGGLDPGKQDFLMLVDSNLGYNKLDKVIKRYIEYSVDLTDLQQPTSRIEVFYENPLNGPMNCIQGGNPATKKQLGYIKPGCYWDYWRVFSSEGTKLGTYTVPELNPSDFLSSQAWSPNPGKDTSSPTHEEVNGLIIVPTESKMSFVLEQNLPESVLVSDQNRTTYSLVIQKQPGMDSLPVKLFLKLPHGARFISSSPAFYLSRSADEWAYEKNLEQSVTRISFTFTPP